MLPGNDIIVEYDNDSRSYCVIWRPWIVVGMGETRKEALDDLRAAARFGIDAMVDECKG